MAAIAQLKALLGIDTGQYKAGMRSSEAATKQFQSRIASVGRTIGAAFTVGAIVSFTKSVISMASEIRHTADNLDVSTDSLQALTSAAMKYGTSAEDIEKGLAKIKQSQGKVIEGDKEYIDALKALNINIEKFKSAGTAEAMEMIAVAYSGASDKALAFSGVMDLMGRSAKKSTAFLKQLASDGLGGLEDEAKKAGLMLEEHMIARLEEAGTKAERFKMYWKNLYAEFLTPGLGGVKFNDVYRDVARSEGFLDKPQEKNTDTGPTKEDLKYQEDMTRSRAEYETRIYLRQLDQMKAGDRLIQLQKELKEWEGPRLQGLNGIELNEAEYKRWEIIDKIKKTEQEIADIRKKKLDEKQRVTDVETSYEKRRQDIATAPSTAVGRDIRKDGEVAMGAMIGPSRAGVGAMDKLLQKAIEAARRREEIAKLNQDQLAEQKRMADAIEERT